MELWGNRAVKSYITSADDVHIKYFHHRQSPTTTGLPAKLNRRQAGGQYVAQIMINVHICRNGILRMSPEYEDHAF